MYGCVVLRGCVVCARVSESCNSVSLTRGHYEGFGASQISSVRRREAVDASLGKLGEQRTCKCDGARLIDSW